MSKAFDGFAFDQVAFDADFWNDVSGQAEIWAAKTPAYAAFDPRFDASPRFDVSSGSWLSSTSTSEVWTPV